VVPIAGTIFGRSTTIAPVSNGSTSYTFTLSNVQSSETEGTVPFVIPFTDLAGNDVLVSPTQSSITDGSTMVFIKNPPVLAGIPLGSYTVATVDDAAGVTPLSSLTVTAVPTRLITSAAVTVLGYNNGVDTLEYTTGLGISGVFAAGVLTLTGTVRVPAGWSQRSWDLSC